MNFSLETDPRKPSALATFFKTLNYKIYSYKNHNHATIALYQQEYDAKKKTLSAAYDDDYEKTLERYNQIYQQSEGDEDTRQLMAKYESGLYDIDEYYERDEYYLEEDFKEKSDYFNRAALIIFYALMESQLKKLCAILKDVKSSRISAADFSGQNYIKATFKYLDLVIELPMIDLEKLNSKIEHYQYVRNRIAHSEAEFELIGETTAEKRDNEISAILTRDLIQLEAIVIENIVPVIQEVSDALDEEESGEPKSGKTLNQVIKEADGLLELIEDSIERKRHLRIYKHEYIDNAYDLLKELSDTLFRAVNEKYNYMILLERLQDYFRPFYPTHTLSMESQTAVKGSKVFKVKLESKEANNTVIRANIKVKPDKENDLELINDLKDLPEDYIKMAEMLAALKRREMKLFGVTFSDFVKPNPGLKICMTFYPA